MGQLLLLAWAFLHEASTRPMFESIREAENMTSDDMQELGNKFHRHNTSDPTQSREQLEHTRVYYVKFGCKKLSHNGCVWIMGMKSR
jgi:hypothetical protein